MRGPFGCAPPPGLLRQQHRQRRPRARVHHGRAAGDRPAARGPRRGDRRRLLRVGAPLYARLNRDFNITHFYFTAPDRVNILRLHALGRAGDRIERVTTLTAERDDDTAFGVEMGPLGTFTLRLVRPWHDRGSGALIGFFNWHVGRIGRRIERDQRAMKELATRDGLTGLYNHRTFHLLLQDEIARAERYGEGLALLMIDIDHFKRVNDAHGHQAGDAVLTGLGERLEAQLRKVDRVCRYGGEEIAVILPSTAAATQTAERLRSVVAAAPFAVADGKTVSITLSIGVATYPTDGAGIDELVSAADNALYAAKAGDAIGSVHRWRRGYRAASRSACWPGRCERAGWAANSKISQGWIGRRFRCKLRPARLGN